MNVIWAWDNIGQKISYLGGHKFIFALLLSSTTSWKNWYPEDTRILYCCKSTYNVLRERNFLKYWDKVYLVDFVELKHTPAWGFPKLNTVLWQTEPCCIVDEDIIVEGFFKENLKTEDWVYAQYNIKNVTGKQSTIFNTDSRLQNLSYKENGAGESYHTALVKFSNTQTAIDYVRLVFQMQKEMYSLGCFEGRTRETGGSVDMEYIMGSDEETLYTFYNQLGIIPDLVGNTGIVQHITRKYGFSEEEHRSKVEEILHRVGLKSDMLWFNKNEIIWS